MLTNNRKIVKEIGYASIDHSKKHVINEEPNIEFNQEKN